VARLRWREVLDRKALAQLVQVSATTGRILLVEQRSHVHPLVMQR
jgi:hypothetical protein